jgi:hypothetical protein
MLNEGTSSGDP